MIVVGALIMAAGVWVILGSTDLSGATLLGAIVYLLGLWVAQHSQRERPPLLRDSTDRAVDDQAAEMVEP